MATVFQFPPQNDPQGPNFADDIPVWMNFYCAHYSTFAANRTRDSVWSRKYCEIYIPYPQQMNTLNSQKYTAGGSLNVRGIEKGDFANLIGAQAESTAQLVSSFFSGGGVLRFDHLESVLSPGDRRSHTFNINMVAKSEAEAMAANNIAIAFQTNVYPISTNNYLTMLHPPLWHFRADVIGAGSSSAIPRAWDMMPLVSVLRSVDINKAAILNTPFITSNYNPICVNIKLSFIELEPALQKGDGSFNIVSRSERGV